MPMPSTDEQALGALLVVAQQTTLDRTAHHTPVTRDGALMVTVSSTALPLFVMVRVYLAQTMGDCVGEYRSVVPVHSHHTASVCHRIVCACTVHILRPSTVRSTARPAAAADGQAQAGMCSRDWIAVLQTPLRKQGSLT